MPANRAYIFLNVATFERELRRAFPEATSDIDRARKLKDETDVSTSTIRRILNGAPVSENTIENLEAFFPNIRQWIDFYGDTSKFKNYLKEELNEIDNWFLRLGEPATNALLTPTLTTQKGIIRYNAKLNQLHTGDSNHVLVIAGSGMGKSVFLRTYFQQLAKVVLTYKPGDRTPPIPIFLHGDRLAAPKKKYEATPKPNLILQIICEAINSIPPNTASVESVKRIAQLKPNFVILIDELDQAKADILNYFFSSKPRQSVFQSIKLIAATREDTVSANSNRFLNYEKLQIMPFTARQVNQYFSSIPEISRDDRKKILATLSHLAQTPLLMYIIGEIYRDRATNPAERANIHSLYNLFFQNILKRELIRQDETDDGWGRRPPLPAGEIQSLLEEVSFYSIQHQCEQTISSANVRKLKNHLEIWAAETNRTELEHLDLVEISCKFGVIHKIIEERLEFGTIRFTHRSFQEFLAAEALGRQIRRRKTTIPKFLATTATPANQQLVVFYVLSPEADSLGIIVEWLWSRYLVSREISQLVALANVFRVHVDSLECPHVESEVKRELLHYVEANSQTILTSDAPFAALRDLGIDFPPTNPSAEHNTNKAAHRFRSFVHAFEDLLSEEERRDRESTEFGRYIDSLTEPKLRSKIDFIFFATKISIKLSEFFNLVLQTLPYGLDQTSSIFRNFYYQISEKNLRLDLIPSLKDYNLQYHFFAPANEEIYYRVRLLPLKEREILDHLSSKLTKALQATNGLEWKGHEDILVELLGYFQQGDTLFQMAETFMNENLPLVEIDYKLSRVAQALSACYPYRFTDCRERSERAAILVIEWFVARPENLFRHHLALALTAIGTPTVAKFFLNFIADPQEEQRWLGTMALGTIYSETVDDDLEKFIISTQDDSVRFFASQALLLRAQTFDPA